MAYYTASMSAETLIKVKKKRHQPRKSEKFEAVFDRNFEDSEIKKKLFSFRKKRIKHKIFDDTNHDKDNINHEVIPKFSQNKIRDKIIIQTKFSFNKTLTNRKNFFRQKSSNHVIRKKRKEPSEQILNFSSSNIEQVNLINQLDEIGCLNWINPPDQEFKIDPERASKGEDLKFKIVEKMTSRALKEFNKRHEELD